MLDTPNNIIQKQREIFFAKTANERFLIGAETIAFGRIMVENSIKQLETNISELELNNSSLYFSHEFTNKLIINKIQYLVFLSLIL